MDTKSKARLAKEEKVETLSQQFAQSKSIIFWDYAGLTVTQFGQLRNQLRPAESLVLVAKNTLIKLALEKTGLVLENQSLLEGPTAILEAENEIAPLKILANALRTAGVGKLKCGFLNGKFVSNTELEYLASLPSKELVFGQIAANLNSPAYNLINLMQSTIGNIIFILNSRANTA